MSVWVSRLTLDGERGEHASPIVYRGSRRLPSPADHRAGCVETAHIPGHVTRDGRDDGPEDGRVWPFLRLAVDGSEWLSAARDSIAT